MNLTIKEITEREYLYLNCPVLFSDEQFDKRYESISNGRYCYKFAWQSTHINPVITPIKADIYSVGIDLNFVMLDINNGDIKLNISLFYYFYDIILHNNWIYVITQLEIIKIDNQTFEIVHKYGLPEFFEEIYFNGEDADVKCLDGQIIKLED